MKIFDMIDRLKEVLKEKEGQVITVRGCNYLVEDGYIVENYEYGYNKKKFTPLEMTKGQLEEFLEFLEEQ